MDKPSGRALPPPSDHPHPLMRAVHDAQRGGRRCRRRVGDRPNRPVVPAGGSAPVWVHVDGGDGRRGARKEVRPAGAAEVPHLHRTAGARQHGAPDDEGAARSSSRRRRANSFWRPSTRQTSGGWASLQGGHRQPPSAEAVAAVSEGDVQYTRATARQGNGRGASGDGVRESRSRAGGRHNKNRQLCVWVFALFLSNSLDFSSGYYSRLANNPHPRASFNFLRGQCTLREYLKMGRCARKTGP